jgi:hypothetical protein
MLRKVLNTVIMIYTLFTLSRLFRGKFIEMMMRRKAQAKLKARNAQPLPSTLVEVDVDTELAILALHVYELAEAIKALRFSSV